MKKYKGYYYSTRKNQDGEYKWYIRSKDEVLDISEETFSSKMEAEDDAVANIDEMYY